MRTKTVPASTPAHRTSGSTVRKKYPHSSAPSAQGPPAMSISNVTAIRNGDILWPPTLKILVKVEAKFEKRIVVPQADAFCEFLCDCKQPFRAIVEAAVCFEVDVIRHEIDSNRLGGQRVGA